LLDTTDVRNVVPKEKGGGGAKCLRKKEPTDFLHRGHTRGQLAANCKTVISQANVDRTIYCWGTGAIDADSWDAGKNGRERV